MAKQKLLKILNIITLVFIALFIGIVLYIRQSTLKILDYFDKELYLIEETKLGGVLKNTGGIKVQTEIPPITSTIPVDYNVPINTNIPVNTSITADLNLPTIGNLPNIDIPINTTVPINTIMPVKTEIPISFTLPIKAETQLELSFDEKVLRERFLSWHEIINEIRKILLAKQKNKEDFF